MRRIILATVIAGVVVGLAGAPASAQTKVRKDRAGDAPAKIDIRTVKVQNNASNYAVTIRIADVQKRRTSAAVLLANPRAKGVAYALEAVPVAKGRYAVTALRADADGNVTPVTCRTGGATVKTGKNGYVRFVLAQSCLGADAGRQVTSVVTYDKQDVKKAVGARSMLRRGDLGSVPTDEAGPITTRRS